MKPSPTLKLQPVLWKQVTIADGFWAPRMATNRTVTLPLEYELNCRNGVLDAYQWEWWDPAKGNPPWHIWMGDVGKWIEAFGAYDLPNETAYAETCANIALVFFAHRMLQLEADRRYADVMERALRREIHGWRDALYRRAGSKLRPVTIKAVPYCLWNNRGNGEMRVWMRESP